MTLISSGCVKTHKSCAFAHYFRSVVNDSYFCHYCRVPVITNAMVIAAK